MIKDSSASKRVTVKDVAARAGVGHPSVSVVLNGAKSGMHVAPATRQRILEAAAELDYRPNTSARAMKTGRFGCIGLLTSTEPRRYGVQAELQHGIHDELATHDLNLMLVQAPDASLTDEAVVPRLLREWMVDGLLIGYNVCVPPQMAEIIHRHHIPSVWLNAEQEFDSVRPDDEGGTYAATQHLLQLGHRRIAYVSIARPIHYSVAARSAATARRWTKRVCAPGARGRPGASRRGKNTSRARLAVSDHAPHSDALLWWRIRRADILRRTANGAARARAAFPDFYRRISPPLPLHHHGHAADSLP
jgi:DNA-binding LacI/PurR family transcriptional regulator